MGNSESRARFQACIVTLADRTVDVSEVALWEDVWRLPSEAEVSVFHQRVCRLDSLDLDLT